MRICFIGDPRSVHTLRWVEWFSRDHDVHLLRTAGAREGLPWPGADLPERGVAGIPGTRLMASVRAVRRYVARTRPDIVHGHFINEAGWFAALSGHRPVVQSAWGSDIYRAPAESRLARFLNPWTVRRADIVTCDSRDQGRILEEWGVPPDKVVVVGWGVDLRVFHPMVDGEGGRARLGIPADAPVVLSPRQWLPNSHIETILDAFSALPGDVHLVLKRLPRFESGYGLRIAQRVAAMPEADRIHVVEEVADEDLPGLYAAADCIVSLCETDGTPMSVLEAMAMARPVVAYRNGSLEEWVTPDGGMLVDRLEVGVVADALRRVLSAGGRAPSNRALVEARADRAAEMAKVETLYRTLARRSDGAARA